MIQPSPVHNPTKIKIVNPMQSESGWIELDQKFVGLFQTISYYAWGQFHRQKYRWQIYQITLLSYVSFFFFTQKEDKVFTISFRHWAVISSVGVCVSFFCRADDGAMPKAFRKSFVFLLGQKIFFDQDESKVILYMLQALWKLSPFADGLACFGLF